MNSIQINNILNSINEKETTLEQFNGYLRIIADKLFFKTLPLNEVINRQKIIKIANLVCDFYNIKLDHLIEQNKKEYICEIRHVNVYIIKYFLIQIPKKKTVSITQIGKVMQRTHGTILHSIKYVQTQSEIDLKYNVRLNDLINTIDKQLII